MAVFEILSFLQKYKNSYYNLLNKYFYDKHAASVRNEKTQN